MKKTVVVIVVSVASALWAAKTCRMRMVFMCRPADAALAGYSVDSSSTNRAGFVWVSGYGHVQVDDGWSEPTNSAGVLCTSPICASTNISWNASSQRLELPSDGIYFTKE